MKLFVSDLDGTLLNSQQELSIKTIKTINSLVKEGMNFSIATARSLDSASYIMESLDLRVPVIIHNGVFIYDPVKKKNIVSCFMEKEDAVGILNLYEKANISPFVYTLTEEGRRRAYYRRIKHHGEELYLSDRIKRGDKRFVKTDDLRVALEEEIIAITAIGDARVIDPISIEVKNRFSLTVHHAVDIYSDATWLEVNHRKANKKEALKKLKKYLNAEKVICFGDHLNDISMFGVADEKYAVANAQDALKEIATGIIKSNNEDGVVLFLKNYFRD